MMCRVIQIWAIVVPVLLIGCASQQYVPNEDEELYGIWINRDNYLAKIDLSNDGQYLSYHLAGDKIPQNSGTFTIVKRWSDFDGNIFYNVVFDQGRNSENFRLIKITNSGRVWEEMKDLREFPAKIDQKHYNYQIYHLFFRRTSQQYVPKENEEIYGTWTNADYEKASRDVDAKFIIVPDGQEIYATVSSSVKRGILQYTIIDKWTDSEGNVWYKRHISRNYLEPPWGELDRISNNGTTLEFVFSTQVPAKCPTKIDPKDWSYLIYYRQK